MRWELGQGCFGDFLYLGDPEFLLVGQLSGKQKSVQPVGFLTSPKKINAVFSVTHACAAEC